MEPRTVLQATRNVSGSALRLSTIAYVYPNLQRVGHWWYTVFGKVLPCVSVFLLSIMLASQLNQLKVLT